MAGISDIRKKSNAFVASLSGHIMVALQENADDFVQMNRNQMLTSMKSDGTRIEPPYRSAKYAKEKGRNYPDLKLTGAFQADMTFITDGEEFFLTSYDEKSPALVDKYSDKIFGIAPVYQPDAQQRALRSLAKLFNRYVLNG